MAPFRSEVIETFTSYAFTMSLSLASRRGNRVDWKFDEENDELPDQPEEPSPPEEDNLKCPTDVCTICYGI